MRLYSADRAVSDKYLPQIQQLLAPYSSNVAPETEDRLEATDIVFPSRHVAYRVRERGYAEQWKYEITIRLSRPSGAMTEFVKIAQGNADWYFYGHSDGLEIFLWYLIDLKVFRSSMIFTETRKRIKSEVKHNQDGTTFLAFDLRSFPPNILVASSEPIPLPSVTTLTVVAK